jgi:hypothetical protein
METVDTQLERIREAKRRLIEFIDFMNTWEEAERKKRNAEPEKYQ